MEVCGKCKWFVRDYRVTAPYEITGYCGRPWNRFHAIEILFRLIKPERFRRLSGGRCTEKKGFTPKD